MKIIVTGGLGFIGGHLCRELLKQGYEVLCIDNNTNAKLFELEQYSNFKFMWQDIVSDFDLPEGDYSIIHLAAKAGVRESFENIREYIRTNILGTTQILHQGIKLKAKKFIFASSSSVYGETQGAVSENTLWAPVSPYASTKASGEGLCYTYSSIGDYKVRALRFYSVYGPEQRPDLLFSKIKKAIETGIPIELYGDGNAQRDYTHVSDIVNGIISALNYESDLNFDVFNLGSNTPYSLLEVVKMFEDISGKIVPAKWIDKQLGDVHQTYANISKAQVALNYNPKVKLEQGIRDYLNSPH